MTETADEDHRLAFWVALAAAAAMSLTHVSLFIDQYLVTFLHEASHGLAAVLTGGRIQSFTISPDASGVCWTMGGFRPLVLIAGYAGSCMWGGGLLLAARKRGMAKPVLLALGAFMLLFTLVFGRSLLAWAVGLGYGVAFLFAALRLRGTVLSFILAFLAGRNALDALGSLTDLITIAHRGSAVTDAQLMSRELALGLVPPVVFALGISVVAVAVFAVFAYFALRPTPRVPGEP